MKAKEYFEKYDRVIIEDQMAGSIVSTQKLLLELSNEAESICKKRHAKRGLAVVAVLKELNQKWNAICILYEKKYGVSPLNKDAFKTFWKLQMPELRGVL